MSALANPVALFSSLAVGGGTGGRRDKRNLQQLFAMTAANGSALHSSTWYSCKNSFLSLALSQVGETMPPLVLQAHPVKSAASSTAQSQSCFSHAHLASNICMAVSSIRAFPVSTDQLALPV